MRPYYTDPYTVEFDAVITHSFQRDGKMAVVLDRSYFYPTSGGQEHDTGTIDSHDVLDVVEDGDDVLHILSAEVRGGRVHCRIDWERRFKNMQQHTGQHILSAAFENLYDIRTVSSRLGDTVGTLDLSRAPTESELIDAVVIANKVVEEDRPVAIHFADPSNISSFKLRKPPKVEGTVRIVEVKDFDFSPCGGTHCTHASEVGVILTGNVEKVRAGLTRLEFVCGRRAIANYYTVLTSAFDASRMISASVVGMPEAVTKLRDQLHQRDIQVKDLSRRLIDYTSQKVKSLIDDPNQSFPVIKLDSDVSNAEELRSVASIVSRESRKSFVVYILDGDICQMAVNLTIEEAEGAGVIDQVRRAFGAKGGGRNGFYSLVFERGNLAGLVEALRKSATDD